MIARIIAELGPWNWMVLGLLLLTLEVFVPGMFMVWFGIAALVTGALSLALWTWGAWVWPVQIVVYLALSVATLFIGRRIMKNGTDVSDEPLLNQRTAQLVGRLATLDEAIVNGYGRVKIGDTLWRVHGRDLPAGTRIKVDAVERDTLSVVAVE
jgi:inner membrane protein